MSDANVISALEQKIVMLKAQECLTIMSEVLEESCDWLEPIQCDTEKRSEFRNLYTKLGKVAKMLEIGGTKAAMVNTVNSGINAWLGAKAKGLVSPQEYRESIDKLQAWLDMEKGHPPEKSVSGSTFYRKLLNYIINDLLLSNIRTKLKG